MTGNSNPIAEIVAKFGGQTKLAVLLRTGQATIWDWIDKRRVPSSRIPTIIALAAQLQPPVHLEPNDFFAVARERDDISRPSEAA